MPRQPLSTSVYSRQVENDDACVTLHVRNPRAAAPPGFFLNVLSGISLQVKVLADDSSESPLPKNLKNQIEKLYQRDADGDIDRNFHSPTGLLGGPEPISHLIDRLAQRLGELLEMLDRAAQFFQDPRRRQRRLRYLFTVSHLEFRLASRPPGTARRIVVHALPNLLIRAVSQQLDQRLRAIHRFQVLSGCQHCTPSLAVNRPLAQIPEVQERPWLFSHRLITGNQEPDRISI